jgi:hypothetical protein
VFFGKEGVKSSKEKPVEKPSGEKPNEKSYPKPKNKPINFYCGYCGRYGHKVEFCFKMRREKKIAKEWAYKDRYNTSHGVPESRMPLPRGKAIVRIVPAWGEKSAMGGRDPVGGVKPIRLVWRQQGDQFDFRARDESRFVAGGRGSGGWSGEFAGGQFARCCPPRAQYGDGRSRSFEMERRNGPQSSFHGFGPPLVREGWFPHIGYRGGFRGGSFDRRDALECANPTLEQMAQHWFYSFGSNPSAESFVHSCARF